MPAGKFDHEVLAKMRKRKRRPGRPSLGTKGRTNVLTLKVSTEERARWRAAAKKQGITLGAWLREAAEMAWVRGASR